MSSPTLAATAEQAPTATESRLNQHVPIIDASAKTVSQLVELAQEIKTGPDAEAHVLKLNAVIKAHNIKVDELNAMIHAVGTARKDAATTTVPDLRATAADMEVVFAKLDRIQSLLTNYELALKLADNRATQLEEMAPPTTIAGKLGSFFSSIVSAPAPVAAAPAPLPPWDGAAIVPATRDYFDLPAEASAKED